MGLRPGVPWRDAAVTDAGARIILICNEGYQSSRAATLQQLGLFDATDVIGGFQAWKAAGLPVRAAQIAASTHAGQHCLIVAIGERARWPARAVRARSGRTTGRQAKGFARATRTL